MAHVGLFVPILTTTNSEEITAIVSLLASSLHLKVTQPESAPVIRILRLQLSHHKLYKLVQPTQLPIPMAATAPHQANTSIASSLYPARPPVLRAPTGPTAYA